LEFLRNFNRVRSFVQSNADFLTLTLPRVLSIFVETSEKNPTRELAGQLLTEFLKELSIFDNSADPSKEISMWLHHLNPTNLNLILESISYCTTRTAHVTGSGEEGISFLLSAAVNLLARKFQENSDNPANVSWGLFISRLVLDLITSSAANESRVKSLLIHIVEKFQENFQNKKSRPSFPVKIHPVLWDIFHFMQKLQFFQTNHVIQWENSVFSGKKKTLVKLLESGNGEEFSLNLPLLDAATFESLLPQANQWIEQFLEFHFAATPTPFTFPGIVNAVAENSEKIKLSVLMIHLISARMEDSKKIPIIENLIASKIEETAWWENETDVREISEKILLILRGFYGNVKEIEVDGKRARRTVSLLFEWLNKIVDILVEKSPKFLSEILHSLSSQVFLLQIFLAGTEESAAPTLVDKGKNKVLIWAWDDGY
jgi:hypothetical protein